MFSSSGRKSTGGTTGSQPSQPQQAGTTGSQPSQPQQADATRPRGSGKDTQQQIVALQEQLEQIQLNAIKSQAQVEKQLQAAVSQVQSLTEQLQETNDSPYLKTSTAVRGVAVVLLGLYIQWSQNSKAVSKLSYTKALRHAHLLMGVGVMGGIGSVQVAKNLEPGPEKKYWIDLHKGSGLLMLLGVIIRIVLRMRSNIPERFPGPKPLQHLETLSHRGFYVLMLLLPASGLTYTYYNGVGIPFFGFSKPDLEEKDSETAQQAIDVHKKLGQFLEYVWVPFHFVTLGYHRARGRSVVKRISPFP